MANDKLITSNVYDIHDKMINIASKYMDVENSDILKAGFMGWSMEAMSMFMRDSILHRNMIYNEAFLNTASMPKSIYNWAKMFNINVITAKPSKCRVQITLNKQDVLDVAKKELSSKYGSYEESSNLKYFVIDRNTPIYAGGVPFMLLKSLVITMTESETGINESITIKSAEGEHTFIASETTSSYIKHVVVNNPATGDQYIVISTDVYQIMRHVDDTIISSSNIIDNKIHNYKFSNQLVDVNMSYLDTSRREFVLNTYFSDMNATKGEKYCLFNLSDKDEFQITFPGLPGDFVPSTNNVLIAEYFTTLGSAGNITYKNNMSYQFEEEAYSNIAIMIKQIDSSTGGSDVPHTDVIKGMIIDSISTNQTLVTTGDLKKYFNRLSEVATTANQSLKFIKKIDDITRRVFSDYILFRDENGYVVPTNTVDVMLEPDSGSNVLSKKPGSFVTFSKNINETDIKQRLYKFANVSQDIESLLETYVMPFHMLVRVEPVPIIKYIYNTVDNSSELSFEDISNTFNKELIPSVISVERDAMNSASDYYKFEIESVTNMTDEELEDVSIKWVIGDSDNSEKFNVFTSYDTSKINQSLELRIDSEVDEFKNNNNGIYGEYINLVYFDSNNNKKSVQLKGDISVRLEYYKGGQTADDKILVVSTRRDLKLFIEMDGVMTSELSITYDDDKNISSITVKEVPLVLAEFFSRSVNNTLMDDIYNYSNSLKESIDILETNTTFDMKFYNTYGLSYSTTSPTTNVSLSLDITPINEITAENLTNIKTLIRDHIDNSNTVGLFSISQLTKNIQETFYDIVEYVEFRGLNDSFAQSIKFSSDKEQYIRTPEYINVTDLNIYVKK